MKRAEYEWNRVSLIRNGKSWFPVMGEFHYSRYRKQDWKKELQKMKAGGIDIVASYVIWIHHEEEEGSFLVGGNCDLAYFLELIQELGMSMFLRVGPWIHGEVRNGGFPDWLLKKEFTARSNDPRYFCEVEKYYKKIADIVENFLWKNGGPIIGIQIENEYHGIPGMCKEEQNEHMKELARIAKKVGLDTPYYTATGWGDAATGGMVPVMGGYCEAPWDSRICEIEASSNYVFTKERDDGRIGTDLSTGAGCDFDSSKFPFLLAELGGGVQVTAHRRPIVSGKDIGGMSLTKIGCGANLLGYYMYHGGTNPLGKYSTMQESKETGYPNDLPVLNYDFMAPLGQYGQVRESYYQIRRYSMFLKDFGEELCGMNTWLPSGNSENPEDCRTLRYAVRHNGEKGYLFINNYQRRRVRKNFENLNISFMIGTEEVTFEGLNIADGDYGFYPFGMEIGEAVLKTALATPLCRLQNENPVYVFYSDTDPKYEWITAPKSINQVITITDKEALYASKLILDQEYLAVAEGILCTDQKESVWYECPEKECPKIKIYPPLRAVPQGISKVGTEGIWTVYEITEKPTEEEQRISVAYKGESAQCFYEGKCIADDFYNGEEWEIGHLEEMDIEKLEFKINPFYKKGTIFLEVPEPEENQAEIMSKTVKRVYTYRLEI